MKTIRTGRDGAGARLGVVERAQHLRDVAAVGPGFALHLVRRHRGENAVEIFRAHPVGDQGAAGAEPVIAALFEAKALEPLRRDQRSPHQDVGKMLLFIAAQVLAHGRMDTVAKDKRVAAHGLAGMQTESRRRCRDTAITRAPDALILTATYKGPDQVGAMDVYIARRSGRRTRRERRRTA